MFTKEQIQEKVFETLKQFSNGDTVSPETKLCDLTCDSLDLVEIIMEFEDHFSISVPEEEAEKISKVQDYIDIIENKISVQNGGL